MNDTTWFWQIVDARGLADVSSDEFVALNELISKAERAEEAEARSESLSRDLADARAALEWYGEQARLARLIHCEGDAGRHALAADGGRRARSVLSTQPKETPDVA